MTRVLLVEDNPIDARLLRADFKAIGSAEFELIAVETLAEANRVLSETEIDVVLLDLFLEDTAGLETLSQIRDVAPEVPVVVLTGLNDEAQALRALKHGAQDYFIKGSVDCRVLVRGIRYAIERKQAENERRVLEQRLLQSQKLEALGTLARGVAHKFNNALMIIAGNSDLMLEMLQAGDANRPYVESIKKAADRAAVVTRQLLTFTRSQAAERGPVSLNKIVADLQELMESVLSKDTRLRVKMECDSDLIEADAGQIGQTIMSLVMNARDAMPDGGDITIETHSLQSGDSRAQVLLTVSDTGCGMSAETAEHIFEPFFTTKNFAQVSGLGLSTAYGIIKQHGGNIQVQSKPDCGTTFSITLPVFRFEPKAETRPAILIMESEERLRKAMQSSLARRHEYVVLEAGDWVEALEVSKAHSGKIGLLIAHVDGPGSARPHLIQRLKIERPEMNVAYVSDGCARRMTSDGMLPSGAHLPPNVLEGSALLHYVGNALP
jgi:signal transduction histidine kinase